ncbi:DUF6640 family protein [uncultured Tateyamaria sp.]|uniref:DUF6640 family protein n=1 Tax=uncultured Tateyamaria sp. TaxID=455651 RepID=UPI00262383B4|nr:DUF6640 family protein [uncultured Tateyamaria sp.]
MTYEALKIVLKIGVSALTVFYGFVPAFADLNEAHLFISLWSAHARFHGAWFLAFAAGVALISLYLMWWRDEVFVPIFLGLMFAVGFWIATVFGPAYGDALVDPNGNIQTVAGIEANMFLFLVVTILLIAALGLAAWIWRTQS